MIDQAFVLAAGFGTRMRPLTLELPKPLLPIAGRPLLELHLDHLAGLGVRRAAVNTHHLSDRIAEFLTAHRGGPPVSLIDEQPVILGTGGGLAGAGRKLGLVGGRKQLLVLNSDVVFDFDLTSLIRDHLASGADVSMALADVPGLNQVGVAGERIVGFREQAQERKLAYLSAQVVSPRVFDFLPASGPGGLIKAYQAMLAAGCFLRAHIIEGGFFWANVDSPELYLDIHRRVLVEGRSALGWRPPGPVHLEPGAVVEADARVEGFASLSAAAVIESGARVRDSVLLAGARVQAGAEVANCILGPGVSVSGRLSGAVPTLKSETC